LNDKPVETKRPDRCETCKNGFPVELGVVGEKEKIVQHKCSKSPHKSPLLNDLWGYIERKGCAQWISKVEIAPKPVEVVTVQQTHQDPVKVGTNK
jgi:hypothetical protein